MHNPSDRLRGRTLKSVAKICSPRAELCVRAAVKGNVLIIFEIMTSLWLCLIICLALTSKTRQAPANPNIQDSISATTAKIEEIVQETDAREKRNIEVPPPEIVCETRIRTIKKKKTKTNCIVNYCYSNFSCVLCVALATWRPIQAIRNHFIMSRRLSKP